MRPASLNPLFQSISTLGGIGPKTAPLFARAVGGELVRDAALNLPYGVIDRRFNATIADAPIGQSANFEIIVEEHTPAYSNRPYRIRVSDETGFLTLVFFSPNPKYLSARLPVGAKRIVTGEIIERYNEKQMMHPSRILNLDDPELQIAFEPVYQNVGGLSQKTLGRACLEAARRAFGIEDWLDESIKSREKWLGFSDALLAAHNPQGLEEADPQSANRRRLAYDELFSRQIALVLNNQERLKTPSRALIGDGELTQKLLAAFGNEPTGAQLRAFAQISADMATIRPMLRLLQGDVGSGKTLVAAHACATAIEAGVQAAFMAPTEILARQHFAGLAPLLEKAGIVTELLTGRDKGNIRKEKLARLLSGEIGVLVGTHALFQEGVEFKDLGFVVIDEQHRFGVSARRALLGKGTMPHLLTMSATPIPRTLSMAIYGDMDMSILDEKPKGRMPIETRAFPLERLGEIEAAVGRAIKNDDRVYWVCPLIEESETLEVSAALDRFNALKKLFGDKVSLIHGRLKSDEKDAAMEDFRTGKTKILVATTVIEVGVDVREASIMVIEHAERFGLAQLHQLRGRVGRGSKPSHCLLLYAAPLTENGAIRIKKLRETDDGFAIAEADYKLRGGGDLLGLRQSGLPALKIADISQHEDLLAMARQDARLLMEKDPDLTSDRGQKVRQLMHLFDATNGAGVD